ncbi:hypothetical protein J4410_04875 [Candidatus Woesearchaeota archaeon]|nr:hypothetical protein [Candidatus Woesearchaeota archaeon]
MGCVFIAKSRQTTAKEVPLAELTLRKYEKPYELQGRELFKKICLSLGLLQPGDSRDVIVEVFQIIFEAKTPLDSETIVQKVIETRKKQKLPLLGIAPSNIRRQIKRLRDLFLVEKVGTTYRITENAKLIDIFTEKIETFYLKTIVERVKEYLTVLSK